MTRILAVDESKLTPTGRDLLEYAKQNGAPDHRIVGIYAHGIVGEAFFEFWNKLMGPTDLPLRLKELMRLQTSISHECGYCTSVRSKAAAAEGVDEDLIAEMLDFEFSDAFSEQEKAALRFSKTYKQGPGRLKQDAVWDDLNAHFNAAQIVELGVFCGIMNGGSPFAAALNIVSWDEVCAINPKMQSVLKRMRDREPALIE